MLLFNHIFYKSDKYKKMSRQYVPEASFCWRLQMMQNQYKCFFLLFIVWDFADNCKMIKKIKKIYKKDSFSYCL